MKHEFKQFRRGIYYAYAQDGTCHVWGNYTQQPSGEKQSVHKYVPRNGDVLAALLEMETHIAQLKAAENAKRISYEMGMDTSDLMATEIASAEARKKRAAVITEKHRQRAAGDVATALKHMRIDMSAPARLSVFDYQNVYGNVATIPFMR